MFRQKAPKLVTVAILTTITLVLWVFFSLYQILTKEAETQVPENLLEEINPTLDVTTLNTIQGKLFFDEGQVGALPVAEGEPEVLQEPETAEEITPLPTTEPEETSIDSPQ